MFQAPPSPWLVPTDGSFEQADVSTKPPADAPDKKALKGELKDYVERFADLQEKLYAEDRRSLLLVFQAMDAAGKDSTIRAVTSGVNPAGFQVFSFKQPSKEELDHDFLWRTSKRNPERGRIGIFNRSYYEEVLVVRVHPEYLEGRPRPGWQTVSDDLWAHRFDSICDHELHLARAGTTTLKFWLKVSKEAQAERFLSRIDVPGKNWKFSGGDMAERTHWEAYHEAYEESVAATSRPWAPWYAIPADDKPFMRRTVASIIVGALEAMDPQWPTLPDDEMAELAGHAEALRSGRA